MLEKANLRRHDVLVTTVDPISAGAGEFELQDEQLFGPYEQELFSRVISPDRKPTYVDLGPHPPRLWPEDVDRLHDIWLTLTETEGLGAKLHDRDVLGVAPRRLEQELTSSEEKEEILALIREEMRRG